MRFASGKTALAGIVIGSDGANSRLRELVTPIRPENLEEAGCPDQRVAWFHANFAGWGELWDPLFREAGSMVWRPLLVCPSDQH